MKNLIPLKSLILLGVIFIFSPKNSIANKPYFHRLGQEIINPEGKSFQIKGANVSCHLSSLFW
jgi:hypothetical protein